MKSNLLAASAANAVKIGNKTFSVATLAEAVQCWEGYREALLSEGIINGGGDSPSVIATIGGAKVRISYNGRCWNPSTGQEILA